MSRYASVCLTLALITGLVGFGGAAAGVTQALFFLFVILGVASGLYRLISSNV